MVSVLRREEKGREPREDHGIMEAVTGFCGHKPRNARSYQKLDEARKGPLLELLEEVWDC